MKLSLSFAVAIFAASALPLSALAHETQQFRIGGNEYKFVVGSLNEPVVVDDKTGVDISVNRITTTGALVPILGLDQSLKVEISAGEKKKEMALTTQYGKPGGYKAVFFPTIQTSLTYRFFGEVEGTPIDLSFACNPAGHPATEDDKSEVKVSDQVTRTLKRGAFGCPTAKAELGFPEPSSTQYELSQSKQGMDWGIVGAVLGALGLVAGIGAWMKKS